MVRTAGDQINASRLHGAMAQHIGQLHNVMTRLVECPRKQVPKVMRKDFGRRNAGLPAQRFHFRPYLFPGQTRSASGKENLTGGDFLFPGILQQLPAELVRDKDGPYLPLEGDLCPTPLGGLHS